MLEKWATSIMMLWVVQGSLEAFNRFLADCCEIRYRYLGPPSLPSKIMAHLAGNILTRVEKALDIYTIQDSLNETDRSSRRSNTAVSCGAASRRGIENVGSRKDQSQV